jgi:hypothetical protein
MIRRSCLALLCFLALVLFSARWPAPVSAQDKFNPYGEKVPTSSGGAVMPADLDSPGDPAGTPIPGDKDMPLPLPPASFVSASGGHFWADGQLFRHVGVNEVDYVYEGGPNSDEWNDTWYLRQGGVKQIRVILANDAYDTPTIIAKLEDALGAAASRGIRVTVALTNFYYGDHWGHDGNHGHTAVRGDTTQNYYTDTYNGIHLLNLAWLSGGFRNNYKPFVHDVVDHFKNDSRIFAWEVGNEIGAPNGQVETAISFYREMALYIKSIDSNHMVTTGIICTQWLPLTTQSQKDRLYEFMDYVVEHHYEPGGNAGDLADDQLAAHLGKPLVIEEFGVDQNQYPYTDHDKIMPRVSDFFDWAYAGASAKQADAVMVWGVDYGFDHGSGDWNVGPSEQHLENDYMQLFRESADWVRPSPRYADVPNGSTFYSYIECLSNRRAVNGLFNWVDDNHNNEFRPGDAITRAQAIKSIVRAMNLPLQFPGTATFTDVPRSSPYFRYIETAVYYGIISGYADHTFRPENSLTRGQMSKVIVIAGMVKYGWQINTAGGPHFVDVPTTDTFYAFIETAYNRGLINGYTGGYFYPGNTTTRGQFAKMLSQAISC